jgi:hypothetical protein
MPVKSKAQMRLMFAVASGKAKKKPKSLSKKEAKEMLSATENKSALPEKAPKLKAKKGKKK